MEQYIQPLIKVCESVFQDFCKTEVKPGRVFFVSKAEYESNCAISGIIGLSGEATGAVAISLNEITAFRITKNLTDTEHTYIDPDVTDAVGEIINIIAGNMKKCFEDEMKIKISLPSIVKGKAHSIVWPSERTRIICIPFTVYGDQEFYLSVAIEQENER